VSRLGAGELLTDGGGVPPELQYDSWSLHAVFSSLHTQNSNSFQGLSARADGQADAT